DPGETAAKDPAIDNGLRYMSKFIGTPSGKWMGHPKQGLYFLWSVERVGVIYQLKTIEGRDWYAWGAEILVANEQQDGSWLDGLLYQAETAAPAIDTSFALLFLKQANLAKDLSAKLKLHLEDK